MAVKLLQFPHTLEPIVVTEAGIVIEDKFLHPSKTLLPIVSRWDGRRMADKEEQPLNAEE